MSAPKKYQKLPNDPREAVAIVCLALFFFILIISALILHLLG